jgi:hypothetical protein
MLHWENVDLAAALARSCEKILVVYRGKGRPLTEKITIFQEYRIKARECKILRRSDWSDFAKSLRYGGDRTVDKFAEQPAIRADLKYTSLYSKKNLRAITALHTGIGKRLIADGGHTCSAIRWELKKGSIGKFPKVSILEFYGDQIHEVFFGDYPSLMKR